MNDRVDESLLNPVVLWSPEAETSLLGALLLDNGLWDRVGDLVAAGDFFKNEHRLIFGALSSMLNTAKPADVLTVHDQLQRDRSAEMIGLPDLKMAITHCETVKDYISRELFTDILESEEEHIDWLQTQMRLIEQMGIENFVQLQTKPNESGS